MPVPLETLHWHNRPRRDRILEVLSLHPGSALSEAEIYAGTEKVDPSMMALVLLASRSSDSTPSDWRLFMSDLEALVAEGRVARQPLRGQSYYFIKSP